MKGIGKRLIAVLAALALAFSVFPLGSPAVEVKADAPNAPINSVATSEADDAIWKAALWNVYCQKRGVDSPTSETWDARYDVIKDYLVSQSIMNDEGNVIDDDEMDWDAVNGYRFENVTIDTDVDGDGSRAFGANHLVVASGGALALNEDWKRVDIYEDATLNGSITITNRADNGYGCLALQNGVTLTMDQADRISTSNGGYILAEPHTKIKVGESDYISVTVGNRSVTFNGEQNNVPYRLFCENGVWTAKPVIVKEVTLPADKEDFEFYKSYYYDGRGGVDHKDYKKDEHGEFIIENGEKRELPPSFDKVTIAVDQRFEMGLKIKNLVVNEDVTLTLDDGSDSNNKWSCNLEVDNVTVNGTIKICNSNCERTGKNNEGEDIRWVDPNRLMIYESLTIGENGSITRGEDSTEPELGCLEFNWDAPVVISIPSLDKIALTDGTFPLRKDSTLKVNDSSHSATTEDGDAVTFDGHQEFDCDVKIGDQGTWIFSAEEHIVKEVVLPAGEKNYEFTKNEYHGLPENKKDHDGEGRTLAPKFEKVTVQVNRDKASSNDPDWKFDQWLRIDNFVTEAGTKVTLDVTVDENDYFWVPDGQGHHEKAKDSQGNIIKRYSSCSGDMYVTNATINGNLTIKDSQVHYHRYNEPDTDDYDSNKPKFELLEIEKWPQINSLEIGSTLTIPQGGSIAKEGNGEFRFSENDGEGQTGVIVDVVSLDQMKGLGSFVLPANATLKVGEQIYSTTVDGKTATFDGNQKEEFRFKYVKNAWKITSTIIKNPVLPEDKEEFWYTADRAWDNGEDPYFESITVTGGEFVIDRCTIFAGELFVLGDGILRIKMGDTDFDQTDWQNNDVPVKDAQGNQVKRKDIGRLSVENAEIAGRVVVEECNTPWYEWEYDADKNYSVVVDSGEETNSFEILNTLEISDNGVIDATAANAELFFGTEDQDDHSVAVIPATSAIRARRFVVNPGSVVKVGGTPYGFGIVKSGNPGDEAVHDGLAIDGNIGYVTFVSQTDDSWELEEDCEIWWGAPFDNEYRVYSDMDGASFKVVGGKEFTTTDFIPFTKGQTIEFEIIPPEGYTGTPIVLVNGGIYYEGDNVYRSDDFLASDSWFNGTVQKISAKNNIVSFVPVSDEGIEFNVFFDPEEILESALFSIDRKYLWAGKYDKITGKWYYNEGIAYDPSNPKSDRYGVDAAWADPANEFIVEVTQNNTNGTVEMTPGVDFYRLGNKVKALYQGFEILGDNEVEIKFKPSSGYDLLALNIDKKSYAPLAVEGVTYSDGVYTLKITDTPTENSTLRGMYADDFKRDYVKIKTISATFGVKSNPNYGGGGSTSGGTDSGTTSGGSTDAVTPGTDDGTTTGGSGASEEAEPEVKKQSTTTDKADDGTQTTTTSTTYTDGSKVTEKVVEKPDGSSTATTTTTEADGTKVVEKVEEKADGSSKATTTTTETDGTKTTETVEKKANGTEVTTSTVKDADGNSTTEKVEKKTDGTVTTTNTTKDADGASTTEKVVEKPDGSVTTTSTEKDADGNVLSTSKVVEKTKEDGTKTITATEKNADGSSSTSKTTLNTDGSSKTNTTTQNADGSTTKEKITEKADGSLTRTATTTDENGNVLATEKEKVTVSKSGTETSTTTVENADGSSSESVVKTKADGSASSTLTETDAKGNVSVTVGSKKTDGSEISKSYAVEDDGVVLTAVEATTASASIPATVKVNGKSVPVTTVGEGAMKDNTSVKKVTLAESITSIGEDAFSGAKNLKTIKLSANITEIAPGAFDGIKKNATFYISAATDEEFDALVELLKKSGVGSKVKFKRA